MKDSEHSFYEILKKHKNQLLMHAEIGKPKECFRDLPPSDHIYGFKQKQDLESAGSLLTSWEVHRPTRLYQSKKDYSKLNKLGVINKITKPKQVKSFRNQHNIVYVKPKENLKFMKKMPSEGLVYGKPSKVSIPINKLINYEFGNEAVIESHNIYLEEVRSKSRESKARKEKFHNERSQSPRSSVKKAQKYFSRNNLRSKSNKNQT